MLKSISECPPRDQLHSILFGRLSPVLFDQTIHHIEQCPQCTATIEDLSTGSQVPQSLAGLLSLRSSILSEPWQLQNEIECQAGVQRLLTGATSNNTARAVLPLDLVGPYRLLKPLGHGGMGSVYLAEHSKLKRMAAVKLLPRERSHHADWVQRFQREMQAVAALEHPHIVRALDAGDQDQWHYLVMEYLDGLDLSQMAARNSQVTTAAVCEIGRQVALGLQAIHALGMVHRDIKPSNIFVTKHGTAKILDLGLVFPGVDPMAQNDRLTSLGHLMGTLAYMAPEQVQDCRAVDARSDIYSLGATLYRMLTGIAPHGTIQNLPQTIRSICEQDVAPIKSHRRELPDALCQLIDRMLARDPAARPATACLISDQLASFANQSELVESIKIAIANPDSQLSFDAPPATIVPLRKSPALPPNKRNRWKWVAVSLLPLFLGLVSGIFLTIQTDRGELVIQSEDPGLAVEVLQGQEVVENLQLTTDRETITLRSGTYTIRLKGANIDGYQLSDSRVLLSRGSKQAIEIKKVAPQVAQSTAPTGTDQVAGSSRPQGRSRNAEPKESPRFQGKSLQEWLSVVRNERDPKILASGIEALSLLATSHEDVRDAAKTSLVPLRTYGSSVIGGSDKSSTEVLSAIQSYYPRYPEDVRIQCVTEELMTGEMRPAFAMYYTIGSDRKASSALSSSPGLGRSLFNAIRYWLAENASKQPQDYIVEGIDQLTNIRQYLLNRQLQIAFSADIDIRQEPDLVERIRSEFEAKRNNFSIIKNAYDEFNTAKVSQVFPINQLGTKTDAQGRPIKVYSPYPISPLLVLAKMKVDALAPEDAALCVDGLLWRYSYGPYVSENVALAAMKSLLESVPVDYHKFEFVWKLRRAGSPECSIDNKSLDQFVTYQAENGNGLGNVKSIAFLAAIGESSDYKMDENKLHRLIYKVLRSNDGVQQCLLINFFASAHQQTTELRDECLDLIRVLYYDDKYWLPLALASETSSNLDDSQPAIPNQFAVAFEEDNKQGISGLGGMGMGGGMAMIRARPKSSTKGLVHYLKVWEAIDLNAPVDAQTLDQACRLLLVGGASSTNQFTQGYVKSRTQRYEKSRPDSYEIASAQETARLLSKFVSEYLAKEGPELAPDMKAGRNGWIDTISVHVDVVKDLTTIFNSAVEQPNVDSKTLEQIKSSQEYLTTLSTSKQ